jgi:acyl-CoA thioesterase I
LFRWSFGDASAVVRLCIGGFLALLSPLQARPLYSVAIGASNTSGLGVGEQNAYPALLERLLRQKGIDAHVTNAGVWGDVTAGMRNRLDSAVPKGTDIVIFAAGR